MKSTNQARAIPTKKHPENQAHIGHLRAGGAGDHDAEGNLWSKAELRRHFKNSSNEQLVNIALTFLPIRSAEAVFKNHFETTPREILESLIRRLLKCSLVAPATPPHGLQVAKETATRMSQRESFGEAHHELEHVVNEALGLLDLFAVKLATLEKGGDDENASSGWLDMSHRLRTDLLSTYNAVHQEWRTLRGFPPAQNSAKS